MGKTFRVPRFHSDAALHDATVHAVASATALRCVEVLGAFDVAGLVEQLRKRGPADDRTIRWKGKKE